MINFNVSSILRQKEKSPIKESLLPSSSKTTTTMSLDKFTIFSICKWNLNEQFLREFQRDKLKDNNLKEWSKNYSEKLSELKKHNILNTRRRTAFTEKQVNILEQKFLIGQYPAICTKQELSSKLNLPVSTIQIWFKNRRAKERKINPEHKYKDSSEISQDSNQNLRNLKMI
ncbi:hypothetical protein A3Q56_03243 [Intoshia linei]|uniref:Homeobox domain-containing protein n=1 Tax=Intoshia linei TaxID=1819745 RepID=A0A177B489_9BILA|nr:hypothetical protein A3Q56_03243 [Intoshia linei]